MAGHLKVTYLSTETSYKSLDSLLITAKRGKASWTKADKVTIRWSGAQLFRRQADRSIMSIYQNGSNNFSSRALGLPNHGL